MLEVRGGGAPSQRRLTEEKEKRTVMKEHMHASYAEMADFRVHRSPHTYKQLPKKKGLYWICKICLRLD